ncbi:protein phosphatase 1 regulatory subunit 15B [Lepisosteus oculatus]|uniref:protein phosphatase 1 regulatory subunit 15B n=1 Tax=Lepisosteus oculatus TaxID=7918 RepID=UPI00371A96E1
MFRTMNSDGLRSKGSPAPAGSDGLGAASLRPENQESSWIGVLSVVSRPALSLLHKYWPGRPQTLTPTGSASGWFTRDFKQSLEGEGPFLDRLEELMPRTEHPPPVTYLHYQHQGNRSPGMGSSTSAALAWFNAESLRDLGIESSPGMSANMKDPSFDSGYIATARNYLSQVLVSVISAQGARGSDGWSAGSTAADLKRSWWGGFWGSGSGSSSGQRLLSFLMGKAAQQEKEMLAGGDYCQQPVLSGSPAVAKPTGLFAQCASGSPLNAESAGYRGHKGQPDSASSQTALPEPLLAVQKPLLDFKPSCASTVDARAATACSEVALLTPDLDNGYSSLEEEQFSSKLNKMEALCSGQGCDDSRTEEQKCPTVGVCLEPVEGKDTIEGGGREAEEAASALDPKMKSGSPSQETSEPEPLSIALPGLAKPSCQNKAIAYILGSPCSEESGSESEDWDSEEEEEEEDEDDDGFDSEGSSEFSDSDSEDERAAEEANAEMERLWNSLCRNRDPYDPRNFKAAIQTCARTSVALCSDASASEGETTVVLECREDPTSSFPKPLELEGDSENEGGSVDEAESLRLWRSFSCSGDPYSLLSFTAPLRTRQPGKSCGKQPHSASRSALEEAEERMDSGFSEGSGDRGQTGASWVKRKKVRFEEEVEEFYASCDEDRRGPWEEFARDRCRFLRRVQETEDAIGYCLTPAFRLLVSRRLHLEC